MNAFNRTLTDIKARASANLAETAAPRLSPKEKARREAARNKVSAERSAKRIKKKTDSLTARRAGLKVQIDKAQERLATLRDKLKACDADIKSNAKVK